MSEELSGIIAACLAPWTAAGTIDGAALERELDFIVGHSDAVSVFGAEATEYSALSDVDRREWLRRGIEMVDGRIPVLAGASSPRVSEVAELAEIAAAAGGSFAQVLMPRRPWGPEASVAELVAYYEAVAQASPLPIVAYHNPARGSDPPLEAFLRLAEIDGVVAFKESSRDMAKIGRLCHELRGSGAAYFTTMQPLLQTLIYGGAGAMMPAPGSLIGAQVLSAFRAGDLERAAERQRHFAEFPSRWSAYGLAPVMRCAMRHLGVDIGGSLPPFHDVSAEDDAAIGAFLADAGVTAAPV